MERPFPLSAFAFLAAFAVTNSVEVTRASSPPPQDMSSVLEDIRTRYGLPGLTAMAIKGGRIIAEGASGVRRQGHSTLIKVNDPVNIASCTKWMNGTIAARLVDRGLISWNTRVRDLFANYSTFHSSFHNATLEQILAHRTGVQDGTTWEAAYWSQLMNQTGSISQIRRWVAETALTGAPQVAPGNYLYSNQGYTVAACMMEIASGKSWETLIQEEIFNPLHMNGSYLGITHNNIVPPLAVVGHDKVNKSSTPVPRSAMSTSALPKYQASNGAGGFAVCTLLEWGRFLSIHNIDHSGFLQPATLQKIRSPFTGLSQGYGLGVSAVNRLWASPGQALNHSGDIFGQDSVFWTAPAKHLVVMAFTNTRTGDGSAFTALDEVAWHMVSSYSDATPSGPLLDLETEFQFATSSRTVAENAATVIIEVVRSWPGSATGSIAYAITSGTAGHNNDFSGPLTGVLNFDIGVLSRTIAIPIINDSSLENDEEFSIHLGFSPSTPANGYSIGSIGSTVVTIQDDDVAPSFSINPPIQSVAAAGGSYSFSVAASGSWSWSLSGGAWVTSSEPASQSDSQTFSYNVEANSGASPRVATITVTSGLLSRTHKVTQAGTVQTPPPPRISLRQPRAFPALRVGTAKSQRLALANVGGSPLSGLMVTVAGRAARDFRVTGPAQRILAPRASTQITVKFRPRARGVRKAKLTISGNAPAMTARLSGRGLAKKK